MNSVRVATIECCVSCAAVLSSTNDRLKVLVAPGAMSPTTATESSGVVPLGHIMSTLTSFAMSAPSFVIENSRIASLPGLIGAWFAECIQYEVSIGLHWLIPTAEKVIGDETDCI